ncbi:hypothetical protein ABH935_000676 [Catenulispora sp. GAS73]|uniref:fibronectin type III-like domain-contianing protein n=1 Tax=Catenulispora sp. GAS73 TaxID=3156269 RepID=UPI003516E0DC
MRTFSLSSQDISTWSTATNGWITPSGTYSIAVGDSSRNLPLNGTFAVNGTAPSGETVAGVAANLCLDDKWGSTSNSDPIWIYNCNGTGAQAVKVAPDPSDPTGATDTLQILGQCVDVAGGGTTDGTLVQVPGSIRLCLEQLQGIGGLIAGQ